MQADKNEITGLYFQKKNKPRIEDVIPFIVDEAKQHIALNLTAWLRENKMSPAWSGVHNAWDAKCKGKTICKISLVPGGSYGSEHTKCSWLVAPYLENIDKYENTVIEEGLQNFVLDNVIYCAQATDMERPRGAQKIKHYGLPYPCNTWGCAPGKTIKLLGTEIANKCCNTNRRFIWFADPNEVELGAVKRILQLEQTARKGLH